MHNASDIYSATSTASVPPMQIKTQQTNPSSTGSSATGSTHERERVAPPAGPGSPYTTTFTGTAASTMPQQSSVPPSPKTQTTPQLGGDKADAPADAGKKDQKEQRLIVVSNRLPVTISKDANGEYHFKVSRTCSCGVCWSLAGWSCWDGVGRYAGEPAMSHVSRRGACSCFSAAMSGRAEKGAKPVARLRKLCL